MLRKQRYRNDCIIIIIIIIIWQQWVSKGYLYLRHCFHIVYLTVERADQQCIVVNSCVVNWTDGSRAVFRSIQTEEAGRWIGRRVEQKTVTAEVGKVDAVFVWWSQNGRRHWWAFVLVSCTRKRG